MVRPFGGPQVQGIADIREQVQSGASELANVLEGTSGTGRCRLGKEKRVTREVFPDWRVEGGELFGPGHASRPGTCGHQVSRQAP